MRKLLYAGVAVLLLPDAVVSSPTARAMDVLGMYRAVDKAGASFLLTAKS